tara:strand:- start:110 stop:385 length:276 start_codon:yes stop_codon:yes gene_type:complete
MDNYEDAIFNCLDAKLKNPLKTIPAPYKKGTYCLTIENTRTEYTTYHGYISSCAVLWLVGRYIIGIDFEAPRYLNTIKSGDLLITIENTAR